jgi:ppGpp synthetase/RelA/SpoT-type nucleotidyltranferase
MLIDNFVTQYHREYDYYQEVARICAQQCEIDLEQSGIRAIVTHRAKRPDRLRQKLEKRNEREEYENFEDIYDDIVDLAGVRIALYFPGDREKVDELINLRFDCHLRKPFPGDNNGSVDDSGFPKRFSGYHSTHYRVSLREDKLTESQARFTSARIEIQVASVLMHAWAEVEHDLIYKPLSGTPSETAHAILDELNGIVLAGEIALERLQKDMKERDNEGTFSSHYELAAFLHGVVQEELAPNQAEPIMGRADVLFRFLQLLDITTVGALQSFTGELDPDEPIVQQLVDRIVAGNREGYQLYVQAKREVGARNPYRSPSEVQRTESEEEALGLFLTRWIDLEKALRRIYHEMQPDSRHRWGLPPMSLLKQIDFLDKNTIYAIDAIRRLRNQVVHGVESPETSYLVEASKEIQGILRELSSHIPENIQPLLEDQEQVG